MRQIFYTLLPLLLFGLTVPYAYAQTAGGPDTYGYTYVTHDDTANGFNFEWVAKPTDAVDITNLKADDNFVGPFNIGFSFPYYWNNYSQFYVGSNGYVMFGRGVNIASGATGFPSQPQAGGANTPNNFIALFLSDLTFTQGDNSQVPGAEAWYWSNNSDSCVVTFVDVPYWSNDSTPQEYQGRNTFQLVMTASGDFTLNYLDHEGTPPSAYLGPNDTAISRGLENISGQIGLSFPGVGNNTPPADSSAIRITYPTATTYQIQDAAISWVQDSTNTGSYVFTDGNQIPITAALLNSGTVPITTTPNVYLQVQEYSSGNSVVLRDTFTPFIDASNPLAPGDELPITFTRQLDVPQPGNFRVLVTVDLQDDSLLFNDSRDNEVIAQLEPVSDEDTTKIGFDRYMFPIGSPPFGVPAPGTEDGGASTLRVGNYFDFPQYPARIVGLEYFLRFNVDTRPLTYNVEIVGEDANGNPGTSLYSQDNIDYTQNPEVGGSTVPAGTELNNFRDILPTPIDITEGGVFVSWNTDETSQPGDTTATGVNLIPILLIGDSDGPASFRSYEITGGQWAPHRDRANIDFSLRLLVTYDIGVSRPEEELVRFELGQNYPNPSNLATTIPLTLKEVASPRLEIRNTLGQLLHVQQYGQLVPGPNDLELNTDFPAGIYTYTVWVNGQSLSKKMIVGQ